MVRSSNNNYTRYFHQGVKIRVVIRVHRQMINYKRIRVQSSVRRYMRIRVLMVRYHIVMWHIVHIEQIRDL